MFILLFISLSGFVVAWFVGWLVGSVYFPLMWSIELILNKYFRFLFIFIFVQLIP